MLSLAILGGELKDRYASAQPSEGRSGTSLARCRRNASSAGWPGVLWPPPNSPWGRLCRIFDLGRVWKRVLSVSEYIHPFWFQASL